MGFAVRVTPTTVYLPFNRECLRGEFVPAKHGGPPPAQHGHWLLVQEQRLVVVPAGGGFRLPTGELPEGLDGVAKQPLWLGTYAGTPGWGAGLPRDAAPPGGPPPEPPGPSQGPRPPDRLPRPAAWGRRPPPWA